MSRTKTFFIFLTGITLGAAAGILFAPYRGEKTRRKMAKRIKQISGCFTDKAVKAGDRLKDSFENTKDNLSKVLHT